MASWRNRTKGDTQADDLATILAPLHPVTDEMRKAVLAIPGKAAPELDLKDSNGKELKLSSLLEKGPVLVYMIKDGCPCAMQAQEFFNQIQANFNGKATILGVTDMQRIDADKYRMDFDVNFPLVTSKEKKVYASYRSLDSCFSTLVGRDGIVIKQFPGYSKKLLSDINEQMAKAAGVHPKPLDLAHAPDIDSSGCPFFQEIPTA